MNKINNGIIKLLEPGIFCGLSVKNKIFMSTMLRNRTINHLPGDLQLKYYMQRIQAGVIFSEPLSISKQGALRENCGGIWNDDQVSGWSKITEKIHINGGVMFGTVSHAGRVSSPEYNGNNLILLPSIKNFSKDIYKEMSNDDIKRVFDEFHSSAINIKKSGFAGIHLHASSGALLDSFIKSSTNSRSDEWGGIEGGSKFIIEIIKRLVDIFPNHKVGIKLSPVDRFNDIYEEDPETKFKYLINAITKLNIGFIEIRESCNSHTYPKNKKKPKEQINSCIITFKEIIKHPIQLIGNFGTKNIDDAALLIEENACDFISAATLYISNPNLPEKIAKRQNLLLPNPDYFYSSEHIGYTDY